MHRAISLCLLLALLCSLAACGSAEHVGIYHGIYVEADGGVYLMEDYFNGNSYLELKRNGDAVMMVNNTAHELTWEYREGELTFTEAGDPFYGWLSEGVIVLDYMGWGIQMTFALDGAAVPETTIPNAEANAEAIKTIHNYWNGDWFGWWYISEGSGVYASEAGKHFDAAAQINLDDNGRGPIVIWDEAHPQNTPLADCILRVDHSVGAEGIGIALSGQGRFLSAPVSSGDWLIDPSLAPYENLLEINGYYADESGDFFYTLFLRPWGQSWEDIQQAGSAAVLPNRMPTQYVQYIAAVEQGKSLQDWTFEAP